MKRFLQRLALVVAGVAALCTLAVPFALPVSAAANSCTGTDQPLSTKAPGAEQVCCPKGYETSASMCIFGKYINPAIKLLSLLVGVAVVGGLTWGGIQYASSAGDAQKVTKAKASMTKALIGIVTFMVFGAFLQFLSPTNITNANVKSCNGTVFLGLKTWYAYLPPGSLNANCELVSDLTILPTDKTDGVLPLIVLAVVDDMLRIAALVAVAFVITGGVQYIVSQGDPGRVKQGMSTIINALIGLAVAVMAAAVVSFIANQLTK